MAISRKSGGANVTPTIKRRSGGAWVVPTNAYRRSGGAWVAFATLVSIVGGAFDAAGGTTLASTASYELTSGGTERGTSGGGTTFNTVGTWLLSGAASDYEVMFTHISGTAPTGGSTLGAWHNLSTTRSLSLTANIGTIVSGTYQAQIRTTTGTVLDTASFNLTSERF